MPTEVRILPGPPSDPFSGIFREWMSRPHASGLGAIGLQQKLHHGDVKPPVEFAAHLAFDPYQDKAAGSVEGS